MADVNISKYRASVVRSGSAPATPGFVVSEGQNPVEPAGSEQNHLPVTINATATGLAITTDQVLSGAGTVGQYIRGDGSLADFPASTGGGSSVSYYLNGSINQGTIGGVAYKELSKTPILGAGTQFTINANGYIASFLTDAGDPNLLEIPGGNWNFETYFSASSGGGSPTFYVELYKYDGSTFTLIASNSGSPELIAFGTNVTSYFSTLAVPTTALALTDRLAIRYYVTHSGRTITLHTENNTLCQIITTFTTGLTALNGLTAQVQYFAVGTSGTDFNIASATQTHTFNLPTASASNRGALSSADWTTFNNKQNALTNPVTGTGTTNYLPKFTGTSTIGNSIVQDAGIRVDIGGDIRLTPTSSVNIQAYTGSVYTNLFYNAASHNWQTSGGATKMFLNSNDNLLIGTTTDGGQRLQVTGTVALRASASGSSATQIPIFNADPSGTTRELVTRTPAQLLSDIGGQAALTNPVTGTGTTNYLPKFTGSTTVGNSAITDDGTSVNVISRTLTITRGNYSAFGFEINQQSTFAFGSTNGKRVAIITDATAADNGLQFGYDTVDKTGIIAGSATSAGAGIDFYTYNGSAWGNRMRITSSGNVSTGSGHTFTSWSNTGNIDLNDVYLSLSSSGSYGGAIANNAYFNSGWKYKAANNATLYQTLGGEHRFLTAGVGSGAGAAISFTQAMTLTSGGNLLVGTTSDNGARLQVSGRINATGGGSNGVLVSSNSGSVTIPTTGLSLNTGFNVGYLQNFNGGNYVDLYYGASRHIFDGGNVGIGTTSPLTRLMVQDSGNTFVGHFSGLNQTNGVAIGTNSLNVAVIQGYTRTFSATNNIALQTDGGNVGIGTTSPGYKTVIQTANQTTGLLVTTNANDSETGLYIQPDHTNGIVKLFASGGTNKAFAFLNGNTEAMRITSSGNVLIGTTTNGSSKLKINGLPTSSAGLASGDVWNDGGTLKIA